MREILTANSQGTNYKEKYFGLFYSPCAKVDNRFLDIRVAKKLVLNHKANWKINLLWPILILKKWLNYWNTSCQKRKKTRKGVIWEKIHEIIKFKTIKNCHPQGRHFNMNNLRFAKEKMGYHIVGTKEFN